MNPEFLAGDDQVGALEVEVNPEKELRKPIDALIVFGAFINSDEKLAKMDRLKPELMTSPEGVARLRLPLAAKLRVVATAELIISGQVSDIIFSGGRVQEAKGVRESEAELMKTYLETVLRRRWRSELLNIVRSEAGEINNEVIEQEVDSRWQEVEPHVILEDQAVSTMQNFSYAVNYLDQNRSKYQHIALLSNGFHIPRIIDTANRYRVEGQPEVAEELASQRDRRYQVLSENYFDLEGNAKFRQESLDFDPDPENPYRMGILMAVQESEKAEKEQDIIEARLGSPMEEAVKIERYNRRAIEMVPEFWLPDVVHVTDLDRLKRVINENSVQELIEAEGVEDIDQASATQLKTALSSIKKKFPPRIWREEEHDYKSDKI